VSSDFLFPTAKNREREIAVNKSQTEIWNPEANSPAYTLNIYPAAITRMSATATDFKKNE